MRASKVAPEPSFLERLRRMYRIMDELASPSGQLPHVGDCDDGRVELLLDDLQQMLWMKVAERNSLRVSRLLGIGKSLFGGRNGSTEDAKWYGLSEATTLSFCPASHKPRPNGITLFPKSGIAIVRAEQAEVLFFAVPNGICGKGSHTHNDKLSFVLRLDGEEVLCDPGTGTYTRDARLRNHFRATAAHNCVVIDGQEQNTIEHSRSGLFWIGTEAEVGPIEQWCEHGSLCLRACHSGYKNVGVMHTRTICFPKERPAVMVEDELDGNGAHTFEINFQLAPDWKVNSLDILGSEILVRVSGRRGLQISCQSVGNMHAERRTSLMSMSYGALTQSSSLRFWGESTFPTKLTTTFSWEV